MFAFVHLPWMLLGLGTLTLPLLIHLWNRRRYEVVDWGAMQFLQLSETRRKRLFLEELLLLVVRMGILALLVFGLAGPYLDVALPAGVVGRTPRDVVLILDGSGSMAARAAGQSPWEMARQQALETLERLSPGDGVAVILAREQPVVLVGELSPERDRVRQKLRDLPTPAGSCNAPEAFRRAVALLSASQKRLREVLFFSDGQRFGLADAESLFRLELLAGELGPRDTWPRFQLIDSAQQRPAAVPNAALAALTCNRPVVPRDREVTFRSAIVWTNQTELRPPHRLRLELDGVPVRDLEVPQTVPPDGRVPFTFTQRFRTAGSHLVSVILEADPPEAVGTRDQVPSDNRQDYAVEVVESLPVLLVDGENSAAPPPRLGADFARDALSPARDPNPVVQAQVVPVNEFRPEMLQATPPGRSPQVVILHDVARLRPEQVDALAMYVESGGGLLVALGTRADRDWYNDTLFRNGEGCLPAKLLQLAGDESKPLAAARPEPESFTHPALELFRQTAVGSLGDARFPRWWRVSTVGHNAAGSPVGLLVEGLARTPFVVERSFGSGRVLLSAVPLDATAGSNLIDLPAFVPFVHEMVYYLAGARGAERNLTPGQPLRHRLDGPLDGWTLALPDAPPLPLTSEPGLPGTHLVRLSDSGEMNFDDTRLSGIYRLRSPTGKTTWYVVPRDVREGDLTPLSDIDRDKLRKLLAMRFEVEDESTTADAPEVQRQELWFYVFIGMIGLLCLEVWMTGRLVRNR
ncbi:MAG: BatA and WFA domain-containing protein [Gemmataceae bacterium]